MRHGCGEESWRRTGREQSRDEQSLRLASATISGMSKVSKLTSRMTIITSQRSTKPRTFSRPRPPSQIPPSSTSSIRDTKPPRLRFIQSPRIAAKSFIASANTGLATESVFGVACDGLKILSIRSTKGCRVGKGGKKLGGMGGPGG